MTRPERFDSSGQNYELVDIKELIIRHKDRARLRFVSFWDWYKTWPDLDSCPGILFDLDKEHRYHVLIKKTQYQNFLVGLGVMGVQVGHAAVDRWDDPVFKNPHMFPG